MQNIEMEGNCPKKDANIAARSSEPFIQIDSIFIDLVSSDDIIDCGKCEHFSIRQFVSETRKKDLKICWPFDFDGDREFEDQTSLLPPLEIPNFSWWRCPNCQREMSSKDFHEISKLGSPEKIKISNSTNLTDNCNPCLRTVVRGKIAEVVCSMTRNVIISDDEANMEMHRLSISEPKTKSSVVLQCINDSVAPKPESNGFRESCQTCHGSCGVGVLEHSDMNVKVNSENHAENFQTGKKISLDDDCRVLFQASDIGRVLYKAHSAVTVRDQTKSSPCTEINRRKLSASEFAEISTGNNIRGSHAHKSNGSLRRKNRKLRLLTELLGENRSMKNKHVEVEVDSLSNETSDASTGQDTLYIPPSLVVIQGNTSTSRKRKIHRDGEWRPREITSCNKNKNIMESKEDVRVNDCMKSSKYENSSQTGLQMKKSLLRKNTSDGDYISCRKKYKKPKDLNPCFPLLQFGENDQQENQEKRRSVSEGAKSKSKSSMSKKDGKMEVKEVMETPFVSDKCLLRLGTTSRKVVERMGNEPMTTPFQSREDEFAERDLSLSSYIAAQRLDTNYGPQHGGTRGLIQFSGKAIVNNRPTQLTSHFTPPAFVMHRMPFPTKAQQLTPQLEDSICFTLQRMGIAGPSSRTKNTEVEEVTTTNKRQTCKRVEKFNGKGAADEIPTEIVELMAKNQFEREIEYAENKRRLPEAMSATRNALTAYHGNSQKQESEARYKINGVITAREVMGPNKQNSVDYLSHISGSHVSTNLNLQQMQSSEGHGAETQAKPCGEIQYSAAGSSNAGNENSINIEEKNSGYGLQGVGRRNRERPYSYQSSAVEKIEKSAMNSLDFVSNETIPAMHLLTLMDAGMPRFPKKSAFLDDLKPNEFSGFGIVSNNQMDPLRFPSSDRYIHVHPSDWFPASSTLDMCTSSQRGIRASNFSAQFASKWQKKECPEKKESSLNALETIPRRAAESVICTVNRNPSDFSLPEAGNIYTIGGSDLKFRHKISHRNQFGSTDEGRRKRKAKHNAAKESARVPIFA